MTDRTSTANKAHMELAIDTEKINDEVIDHVIRKDHAGEIVSLAICFDRDMRAYRFPDTSFLFITKLASEIPGQVSWIIKATGR